MKFQQFSFGQIRIDDVEYGYDVVIDRGKVAKRKESLQEVPRSLRTHAALSGGGDPVEMLPPGGQHGRRSASNYGGSEGRSQASQD